MFRTDIKRQGSVIVALLLATAAAPAAAAKYIDSTSSFITTGTAGLYNGAGFDFKPLDFPTKHFGVDIETGSIFTGYYGAKVDAHIGATLQLRGNVSFTNSLKQLSGGNLKTFAGNPFGSAKDGFYLTPSFSGSKTTTSVGKGQVDASLRANVYAGAGISGEGCIVFCISGEIAGIDVGKASTPYNILGYHSATNSVQFLDKNYDNVLPKDFTSDSFPPISARLEAINVSGTATGKSSTFYHTSQQIAGAYVDVAQAVATAFGLPSQVLSGSALGFDYTTVSAKIGAGINALYDVGTGVERYVIYHFSSPVQIYNDDKKKYGSTTTSVSLSGTQTLQLRPLGDVASLSILPEVVVYTQSTATLTLNATIEDHVKLLEVSGYGLHAGPLYKHEDVVTLGKIGTFTAHTSLLADTALAPLTLDFTASGAKDASLAFADAGSAVPLTGARSFVFVPDPGAAPAGDTVSGTIRLATNYGSRGCADEIVFACVFDRHFRPIAEQQRTTRDVSGAPVVTFATDFATADGIAALPDGAFGAQSTEESIRAMVHGLPPRGSSYALPADLSDNSTPFTPGLPEPASWAMMVAGFGLVGAVARRRTTAVTAA